MIEARCTIHCEAGLGRRIHFEESPMTPFTVFVCSTFSDLSQEREQVLDAIKRVKLQHDSMEFFGARSEQPIETCLKEVRASDVIIVIVGYRYGSIAPGLGISFSEAEYQEANRLKRPCLVYMRDESVPILPRNMESDPEKMKLLTTWKDTLQSRHTISMFEDSGRLAAQVEADLSRTIREREEIAKEREKARTEAGAAWLTEVTSVVTDALNQGVPEASLISAIRSSVSSLLGTMHKRESMVFLSYASADRPVVLRVAKGLAAAGVKVWSPETSLDPGTDWMQEIERALSAADFFVFFISQRSVTNSFAARELRIALDRKLSGEGGAIILPIMLEDAEVPPLLRDLKWIDLRGEKFETGLHELVHAIRH
jgi:hypothetical protein